LPDGQGGIAAVLAGRGTSGARLRKRFALGAALAALPDGLYRLDAGAMPMVEREETALGFLLAGYRFDRYRENPAPKARLVVPEGLDAAALEITAEGECLTRDLINTPPNDMGPEQLENAARALADRFGAAMAVTRLLRAPKRYLPYRPALSEDPRATMNTVPAAERLAERLIDAPIFRMRLLSLASNLSNTAGCE